MNKRQAIGNLKIKSWLEKNWGINIPD